MPNRSALTLVFVVNFAAMSLVRAADLGPQLGAAQTQRVRVGVTVTAAGGPCKGIVGTTPVPIDWPEQSVKIVDEETSPFVKSVRYRVVAGGVKQMLIEIPQLPAGEEAK